MLRILIAENFQIIRRGIKQMLLENFSTAYIEETDSTEKFISKVLNNKWDLVIANLALLDGILPDSLLNIKHKLSGIPILFISSSSDILYSDHFINSRTEAFLPKNATQNDFLQAVQLILLAGNRKSPC